MLNIKPNETEFAARPKSINPKLQLAETQIAEFTHGGVINMWTSVCVTDCVKSNVSSPMCQARCVKTDVSRSMYQDRCQDRCLKSDVLVENETFNAHQILQAPDFQGAEIFNVG